MLDVGFFQVTTQLGELGLTLLVELDLGRGGASSFLKALSQLFEFAGEVRALLLSLEDNIKRLRY